MFKLIFVVKCLFILVTPNPLQGLQSCPQAAYQQNYVNHDQPIMTQVLDGYPQLLHQTWPIYQNIPITSKGYYDNLLLNVVPNTFVDANVRIYDQNGIDITQYITGPRNVIPNIISNYVTIPQDYLKNRFVDNERLLYIPSELTVPIKESQHFRTINDIDSSINYNGPIQNVEGTRKNNNKKRKLSESKRTRNREENQQNKPVKCKPSSKSYKRKNNVSDKNICELDKRHNYKCTQKAKSINNAKVESSILKKKSKDNIILDKKQKTSNDRSKSTTDETVHIKDARCHGNILNEDVFECLDINENCIDLESRRTRNNYNINPVETFQQFPNMPKEFNSNIASYLNSFMPNQNFNTDLFTANGNFPYNFDYMNQMSQNSNSNPNGSEKRRRNRRRKKKQKNNKTSTKNNDRISTNNNSRTSKNNNENSNNNKQNEDKCNKVVELLPNKPIEIKIKTKPIPTASVQINDIVSEKDLPKVDMEAEIVPHKVDEDSIEVIFEPSGVIIDEDDKDLLLVPVSQESTVNVYDNDIFDDYYPDFTSDNFYLSKEDQDYNFHDRHYYSADSKPAIGRERRKYEPNVKQNHKTNRIDTLINDDIVNTTIKEDKKISSTDEVKFKTPPGLDFPDFKTEIINKDKYSPRHDINYQSNKHQNDKVSSFSKVKSIETKSEKNVDNAVETVFAHSKVAKYGVPEYEEKSNKNNARIHDEFNTDRHTNDEKTTIVLAQSLNYPMEYK